ncbi:NAD-dependent epimerase/dehydratase family protein [Novosphingobium sp.]|uniref:NAD-dependent epimerase/dehydratase family protein n=1 Tax=Novosphingobium sp. TaxID=1874826 RepID=UPI003D0B9549
MTERPVAIIGGGLIGAAGAQAIDKSGNRAVVVTRAPPTQVIANVDWQFGGIESERALEAAGNCRALVLASGSVVPATKIAGVEIAIRDEILPVVRLAETAARAGASVIIFISSGGTVYGPTALLPTPEHCSTNPITTYGMIKVLTENALLEVGRIWGVAVVILRVSNPYGPAQIGNRRLGFVAVATKAAANGEPLAIWGDGTVTRDFVFIDDVGRAIALAVDYAGGSVILNIGSGEERSLREVCELIETIGGRAVTTELSEGRSVDVPRSVLDISRAKDVLGWVPEVSIEDGIARTIRASDGARL